jgi:hypothetical protein
MAVKVYLEKEKIIRTTAIIQLILGIACLLISIGLFATMDKYAVPIFAFFVSLFMLATARKNILQ